MSLRFAWRFIFRTDYSLPWDEASLVAWFNYSIIFFLFFLFSFLKDVPCLKLKTQRRFFLHARWVRVCAWRDATRRDATLIDELEAMEQ